MITVQTTVNCPISMAWERYINADDIIKWNSASPDWHTTRAENNVVVGGTMSFRMEAKDGSEGFDFSGVYTDVKDNMYLAYTLEDGRHVEVTFEEVENGTHILVSFEPENMNPNEMQQAGWQAILDNFKKYVESL